MTVRIYHNPRCSKSRQALQLLQAHGDEAEVVRYLETPPDAATLDGLLQMLGLEPRELMRKGEAAYKASGAEDPNLSRGELIALMVANPILIERPIVVANGRAVIGRPPERVLEIL
jgi:arsenate reductase